VACRRDASTYLAAVLVVIGSPLHSAEIGAAFGTHGLTNPIFCPNLSAP
jgi:hypothetical protein